MSDIFVIQEMQSKGIVSYYTRFVHSDIDISGPVATELQRDALEHFRCDHLKYNEVHIHGPYKSVHDSHIYFSPNNYDDSKVYGYWATRYTKLIKAEARVKELESKIEKAINYVDEYLVHGDEGLMNEMKDAMMMEIE